MKKKTEKRKVGVFRYDLFPYMTAHEIRGFDDDGDVQCNGFAMNVKGLIVVNTGERANLVEKAIEKAKRDYSTGQKKLKDDVMSELLENFPELDVKK